MVPVDVAVDITTRFPAVRLFECDSEFVHGFAVEISVGGCVQRNGWIIEDEADWPVVKDKAMKWLTSRYHS